MSKKKNWKGKDKKMKKSGDQLSLVTKIIIFILMFILVLLSPNLLQLGVIFNNPTLKMWSPLIYIVGYVLVALFAYQILKPNLKTKQFGKFTGEEINTVFKTYGLIIAMNMLFHYLMTAFFNSNTTANQENINQLLSVNNIVLITFSLSAVFIAPFVEEFVFRGIVINYFFKNKAWWINVALSGFLFSIGHASDNIISFLLYATMGMILAYTYKKSGQIKMSIAVHMLNNGVAMIFTILGVLFSH